MDVQKRANELHDALPIATQRRTTTAVGLTEDGLTIVGSSEKHLRKSQRLKLKPNEIAASGEGHAEETVFNTAKSLNKSVKEMAASRKVCSDCENLLKNSNIKIITPLSGKKSANRIVKIKNE